MKSSKCFRAKPQYYANICLKYNFPGFIAVLNMSLIYVPFRINVKLGGINTIPDPASVSVLTDPRNPTIVMGIT